MTDAAETKALMSLSEANQVNAFYYNYSMDIMASVIESLRKEIILQMDPKIPDFKTMITSNSFNEIDALPAEKAKLVCQTYVKTINAALSDTYDILKFEPGHVYQNSDFLDRWNRMLSGIDNKLRALDRTYEEKGFVRVFGRIDEKTGEKPGPLNAQMDSGEAKDNNVGNSRIDDGSDKIN